MEYIIGNDLIYSIMINEKTLLQCLRSEEGINMDFSTGVWDSLFGKKVELEIPDGNGGITKRLVTKKWYENMLKEGKLSIIADDTIKVHMLHSIDGYIILEWVIGEDVDRETVMRFTDEQNNELYAMTFLQDGEEKVMIVKEAVFVEYCEQFGVNFS